MTNLLSEPHLLIAEKPVQESLEIVVAEEAEFDSSIPLRRSLLITIIPTVLLPLAFASVLGYSIIQQRTEN
ncbi:MAG: hypothetical protein F6K21_24680, partial [Symploca sp. SIO2D2]|nr:hypothetical protein [Symploca sp. SIO2D2]